MSLSVAIAGCGYFSRFHQEAWSRMGDVRVVGIADQDPARLSAAAALFPKARRFEDAEAMLGEIMPDLVDIVTPPATHLSIVRAAAEHGVNVICQKPLAPTFEEASALVQMAEHAGITLAVHENFRFMPWFMETARLIGAGAVGRPLNITFRQRPGDGQGPDAYLSRQPYFQTMPRFLLHEVGIHLIDVFRFLLGEITGVFARLRRLNPVITGEDAGIVVFEFASGAAGIFDGNRLVDHPSEDARMTNGVLLVEGTQGVIRLDGYGRLFLRELRGTEREHPYAWEDRGYGGDCVYRQSRHVADHLLKGMPLVNSGREYLRNVEIEEAAYRSAAEGRFIAV
jgi:predicted dehydrogenase